MQRVLCIACIFFSFISVNAQSKFDILHYRYQLEINDNNDSIFGLATITFTTKENISSLSFDLAENTGKKGMLVSEAGFIDPDLTKPSFRQEPGKIVVQPSSAIAKGDTQNIWIKYKGIPSDGLIISKNKYGHRTFFADNWPNR